MSKTMERYEIWTTRGMGDMQWVLLDRVSDSEVAKDKAKREGVGAYDLEDRCWLVDPSQVLA